MNDNNSFWMGIVSIIGLSVVMITFIVSTTIYKINCKAFENGYESQSLPGQLSPCWVKAK